MTKQTINIGRSANDKTGDPIRVAFRKVNLNFDELYSALGADGQIPPQTGNANKYLKTDGTTLSWATVTSGVTSYTALTDKPTIPTSFSSLVNSTKTVSLGSTGVLSLPAQGLLTNVNQIASATINRTGANTDTAAIQEAWDIWYGNELTYRAYLDQEVQPGFPPRPWHNKPSWEGYPLLMDYLSSGGGGGGGGQLPPNPNLAPVAVSAINAYLTYKELVSNIDIVSGNKAFSFENTGELSLPATLVFKDAANAKIVLKGTDNYGYVLEPPEFDKAWTFGTGGDLTFPSGGKVIGDSQDGTYLQANPGNDGYAGLSSLNGNSWMWTANDGGAYISSSDGATVKSWSFNTDGKLTLPIGGDIVDSNGTSVLGGVGGGLAIGDFGRGFTNTLDSGKITTSKLYNRPANLALNNHYELGVTNGGVVTLPDGSIINGATLKTVPGNYAGITAGPASPAGKDEDSWVWVDNDGATISTKTSTSNFQWKFDNNGDLNIPPSGTIRDAMTGDDLLRYYDPDDTDNWNDPTVNTIQAALDELAARVTALQNYEIDGGNAYTPAVGELLIDGNGA